MTVWENLERSRKRAERKAVENAEDKLLFKFFENVVEGFEKKMMNLSVKQAELSCI